MNQLEISKSRAIDRFSLSTGVSKTSEALSKAREAIDKPRNVIVQSQPMTMLDMVSNVPSSRPLSIQLYDALASFKIRTANIARYLEPEWRSKFFAGLDRLLNEEAWEKDDSPPTDASFATLLRMLTLLRPERPPGLGATHDGKLIASWTVGRDRLTIECLKNDRVVWIVSCSTEGELERAAGEVNLSRLIDVLAPYNPNPRWFRYGT